MLDPNKSGSFPNPSYPQMPIFTFYDTVRLYKNIKNNWMTLKNLGKTFVFPDFFNNQIEKKASFNHLREAYNIEKELLVKQAYKLNFKTLFPNSMEKQKVVLTDNIFHESTIAFLKQNEKFHEYADFLELIRKWWLCLNIKTKYYGIRIIVWHDKINNNGILTKDTYSAVYHSTSVMIRIIKFSLTELKINYVLPGKFQSDHIENRFGLYRSLGGFNYKIDYTTLIQNEKKNSYTQYFYSLHFFRFSRNHANCFNCFY